MEVWNKTLWCIKTGPVTELLFPCKQRTVIRQFDKVQLLKIKVLFTKVMM